MDTKNRITFLYSSNLMQLRKLNDEMDQPCFPCTMIIRVAAGFYG